MALPAARQVADFGTSLVTLPAPRGSRTVWESGDIVQDNGVPNVLINLANAVSGEVVSGVYAGEFEVTCATGVTASAGADAFYDEANRTVVTAPGANIIYLGTFEAAKTSGQLVARVRLAGSNKVGPGVPITQRFTFTAAQVNAGATILPAQVGLKYRLVSAVLIAVGGNAAGATAVTINATQGASGVALLSATVGALTQNTWVGTNSANVTMLANSDAQNDVNTALTIAKTGGSLSGATSVNVILTYELAT
jgi:hypothetical protein